MSDDWEAGRNREYRNPTDRTYEYEEGENARIAADAKKFADAFLQGGQPAPAPAPPNPAYATDALTGLFSLLLGVVILLVIMFFIGIGTFGWEGMMAKLNSIVEGFRTKPLL